MKTCTLWISLLMAVALMLPAGFALGQGRMAEVQSAKRMLASSNTFANRLNLGTVQYLEGVGYLRVSNLPSALQSMRDAVATLEAGGGMVPDSHPVFESARYGLGYTLVLSNKAGEALGVLDKLVTASPDFHRARYLLGVTLMSVPGQQNATRGMSVLTALAKEGEAPYDGMAARAATRYGYNHATLVHARGDAAGASQVISGVTNALGDSSGSNSQENLLVRYSQGVYAEDTGDLFGAVERFEAAYAMESTFFLRNGVTVADVLSNAYYAAALDRLQIGSESGNRVAITMFEDAAHVGKRDALDVQHGLAVAFTRVGEIEKAQASLKVIVDKDAQYYERIKAK